MTNLKIPKLKQPFTPIMRRFLQDVFKPTVGLGKRGRDSESESENIPPSLAGASSGSQRHIEVGHTSTGNNCLALQNEDAEEDAVVITALSVVPFCCHADLLAMSRSQLDAVAETLNARLPHALQIDVSPLKTDAFVRNSIEVLVGIRRDVPPAPRATKKRSLDMTETFADTESVSVSPLASRSHNRSATANGSLSVASTNTNATATASRSFRVMDASGASRLEALKEDSEELEGETENTVSMAVDRDEDRARDEPESYRPMKRRRIAEPAPIPSFIHSSADNTSPSPRRKLRPKTEPLNVARSQSQALRPKTKMSAAVAGRVLRSQSQRLPVSTPDRAFAAKHRNITTTRGRSQSQSTRTLDVVVVTSTPKARVKRPRPGLGAGPKLQGGVNPTSNTTLTLLGATSLRDRANVDTDSGSGEDMSISPPSTASISPSTSTTHAYTPRPEKVAHWLDNSVTSGIGALTVGSESKSLASVAGMDID